MPVERKTPETADLDLGTEVKPEDVGSSSEHVDEAVESRHFPISMAPEFPMR
jgi:hypothetical protein